MSNYSFFAKYYDSLTMNIDYKNQAEYYKRILEMYSKEVKSILDLACGTGSLSIELKKLGFDVMGLDSSSEMLSYAKSKSLDENLDILFICQEMQNLQLLRPVDAILCCLDSINHLGGIEDVQRTFMGVNRYLNSKGLFIFDLNTVYKHKNILANNTFVYDLDEIYCVWQNSLNKENNKVKIDLDFFEKYGNVYKRESESFFECAYELGYIEQSLLTAGFEIKNILNYMTMDVATAVSEKIVVVAQKV